MRYVLWPQVRWRAGRGACSRPRGPTAPTCRTRSWTGWPDPGLGLAARGLAVLRFFQSGQLPLYLLYILLTLVALLVWMVA